MKYLYLVLTVLFHLAIIISFSNFLKNLPLLLVILAIGLTIGILLAYSTGIKNKRIKDIGWGVLFGSFTTIVGAFALLLLIGLVGK